MKNWLHKVAFNKSGRIDILAIQFFLWLLSLIYLLGISVKNLFYSVGILRGHQFSPVVISVGNLTVGGSGKTPLVEFIARFIKNNEKLKSAILIRGYMEKSGQESDEALMLQRHLPEVPIIVGKNRVQAAETFLKTSKVDVFIVDDGFQHRKINRSLDIVVVDATNPFGNHHLLPRGILREPLRSIKRAQLAVVTRVDLVSDQGVSIVGEIKKINPDIIVSKTIHRPSGLRNLRTNTNEALSRIDHQQIVACSSIGNPAAFEKTLNAKTTLVKFFQFPDHHVYDRNDIEGINQFCQNNNVSFLLTTEKDAVKLSKFLPQINSAITVFSLNIEIVFVEGEEAFLNGIRSTFSR